MVSTKRLPTYSPNTPKPKLRRSIPFGFTYAHAYGYEKLSNEYDMDVLDDVNVAADDDITAADSVFSVFFSVGDQSMSPDECSYSYSLSSDFDPFHAREPSRTPSKKYSVTIDTSDYSNCTFDLSYMSRHAGLDYNGLVPPKQKDGTSSVKADIPSRDDLSMEALSRDDEDILAGARIIKEHLLAISCHQQLEKTFDSDIDEDEDISISAKLLPGNISSVPDERKGHRVGKWLRCRKPKSARRHSFTSPAA